MIFLERTYSVFQGWFANPLATFQQYCLVPAAITAKVCAHLFAR